MIKQIITNLLLSLLTEEVIKQVIVLGLYKFSESTDNDVDDELAKIVDKALTPRN